jgi:hypothetical protein
VSKSRIAGFMVGVSVGVVAGYLLKRPDESPATAGGHLLNVKTCPAKPVPANSRVDSSRPILANTL